jgi:flagellar hook-associated protein 1 FlgK
MSSTFGGLGIAVSGLAAQQAALDTVAHNISNQGTTGYSRQSVNLSTTTPTVIYGMNGAMSQGSGVDVQSITRARDSYTDKQYWQQNASLGYGQTLSDSLNKIQTVFAEPSDTGVQTVLNKFWTALNSLSTNANDAGARADVRQTGQSVVDTVQNAASQLKTQISDLNTMVDTNVDKINQLDSEILALNKQIVQSETGGTNNANDLRDSRDALVDQLSNIVTVRVTQDKDGSYNIQAGSTTLVDASSYQPLAIHTTKDADYGYAVDNVVLAGSNPPVNLSSDGGVLQGAIEARDDQTVGAKAYLNKLSAISQFLLKDFNQVQRSGLGADNSTGNNFFGTSTDTYTDSTGTTYTDPGAPYNSNAAAGENGWPATWPTGATLNPPLAGDWLNALTVNPKLWDPTNGLNMIAAKTYAGQVTKSNMYGGALTVGATASSSGFPAATTTASTATVKLTGLNSTAGTASIEVTYNGVTVPVNGYISGSTIYFDKAQPSSLPPGLNSLNLQIANNGKLAEGDTYTFSLGAPQGNAAGDNAILLDNRLKSDAAEALGGASMDSYYSALTSTMGIQAQDAKRLTDNQTTLVNQIVTLRESVSGVSVDEELSNMIKFQKGYSAAARVLTTMDDMLDKLINSTGMVGR